MSFKDLYKPKASNEPSKLKAALAAERKAKLDKAIAGMRKKAPNATDQEIMSALGTYQATCRLLDAKGTFRQRQLQTEAERIDAEFTAKYNAQKQQDALAIAATRKSKSGCVRLNGPTLTVHDGGNDGVVRLGPAEHRVTTRRDAPASQQELTALHRKFHDLRNQWRAVQGSNDARARNLRAQLVTLRDALLGA